MDLWDDNVTPDTSTPQAFTPDAASIFDPFAKPPAPVDAPSTAPSFAGFNGDTSELQRAIAQAESRGHSYRPDGNLVTSNKGAQGRMQVMPSTNANPGFGVVPAQDQSEAERIRVGNDYIDALTKYYGGDLVKAAAAYNCGPGNVNKAIAVGGPNWLAHTPTETQNYIPKVLNYLGSQQSVPQSGQWTDTPAWTDHVASKPTAPPAQKLPQRTWGQWFDDLDRTVDAGFDRAIGGISKSVGDASSAFGSHIIGQVSSALHTVAPAGIAGAFDVAAKQKQQQYQNYMNSGANDMFSVANERAKGISPQTQAEDQSVQQQWHDAKGISDYAGILFNNPSHVLRSGAGMVASMAPAMVAGAATGGAGALPAFAGTLGLSSGGEAANQASESLSALTPQQLQQTEIYQTVAQSMPSASFDQIKQATLNAAQARAEGIVGGGTAALTLATGGIGGLLTQGIDRYVTSAALNRGAQFAGHSVLSGVGMAGYNALGSSGQDYAEGKPFDPSKTGQAAAEGFVTGVGLHIGNEAFGAARRAFAKPSPTLDPNKPVYEQTEAMPSTDAVWKYRQGPLPDDIHPDVTIGDDNVAYGKDGKPMTFSSHRQAGLWLAENKQGGYFDLTANTDGTIGLKYRDNVAPIASDDLKSAAAAAGAVHEPNAAHDEVLADVVQHEAENIPITPEVANVHEAQVEQILTPHENDAVSAIAKQPASSDGIVPVYTKPESITTGSGAVEQRPADTTNGSAGAQSHLGGTQLTVPEYVDNYINGKYVNSADDAIVQFAHNNAQAIEAEFQRRASLNQSSALVPIPSDQEAVSVEHNPTTDGEKLNINAHVPIGQNTDGYDVYQDQNGVRSIFHDGIKITESVAMQPTQAGGYLPVVDIHNRRDEFKTKAELGYKLSQDSAKTSNMTRDQIADRLSSLLGHVRGEFHERVADAILNKDYWGLSRMAQPHNKSTRKIFSEATGIKLPPTKLATNETLREWAGVTKEQVDAHEQMRVSKAKLEHEKAKALEIENNAKYIKVKDENANIVDGKTWVDDRIANGFNRLIDKNQGRGVPRYLLADKGNRAYPIKGDLMQYARSIINKNDELAELNDPNMATKSQLDHLFGVTNDQHEPATKLFHNTDSLTSTEKKEFEQLNYQNNHGMLLDDSDVSRLLDLAKKANEPVEHPGLVIHTLRTGEEKIIQPEGTVPPKQDGKSWGADNSTFTRDQYEKLKAEFRKRTSGSQVNSGIDPELVSILAQMGGFHIEAGARKFVDFARALSEDLGQSLEQLKPYLESAYVGARSLMRGQGLSVDGMDTPSVVEHYMDHFDTLKAEVNPPNVSQSPIETLRDKLINGDKFATIVEARKAITEVTGDAIKPGTADAKRADEMIEAAVVQAARHIVTQGSTPVEIYRQLVDLYGRQPNLGVRSSTSIEQQAYSTPVPLAYLASELAGISRDTTVYEPSAGNGALLIASDPKNVTANELNPDRVNQLRQNYPEANITQVDASTYVPSGPKRDVVIANPPFGVVKETDGSARLFDVGGNYLTREIDHAISMEALKAMKDDGHAVLIVGSIAKTILSDQARADAYNGKAKREFYFRLYSEYNVTDHFTVAGELYSRQGAGWPVDVIVINGRGKSQLKLPAVQAPRVYDSWTGLETQLERRKDILRTASPEIGAADSTIPEPENGNGRTGASSGTGRHNLEQQRPTNKQPDSVRDGLATGQSSGGGLDDGEAEFSPAVFTGAEGNTLDQPDSRPSEVISAPIAQEGQRQVSYVPASESQSLDTLVPANMQTAVTSALNKLQSRVGKVDDFVANRLGYDPAEISKYFSAEQMDALALAIDNMERGSGFIIGDQTGIGKGRVVAGIIRYAIRSGRMPIFATEKPNLYSDMYRDMNDIGLPEMLGRPIDILMTNSGEKVPLDDDGVNILKTPAASVHNARLESVAHGARDGVDVVFTTYAQMQAIGGNETPRQRALAALAPGSILILDESHNAGGQGQGAQERLTKKQKEATGLSRAQFVRNIAQKAHGVFFSSATYAKRPEVMDLYASTDMKLAVSDISKLSEAIIKGGIPMQQVVATMLTEAGQYVRRERSFDGVEYRTPSVPVDRKAYAQFANVLNAIQQFQEHHVAEKIKDISNEIRESAQSVSADNSMGSAGATSTNFTAVMHNLVEQMLVALKAEHAANMAIEAIKAGRKPVITLANTMGSFIDEYATENNIGNGGEMPADFRAMLDRYLNRTRQYTVKQPFSPDKGVKKYISDAELGAEGLYKYKEIQKQIKKMALDDVPISPIDYIRSRLAKEGYTVGEITGRTATMDYTGDTPTYRIRPGYEKSIAGKRAAITGFNNGTIDAMILNQSGSTGLSLHSSSKYKDQRQRQMIIAQAERNIDTHMQMLGRVHRTGQVNLPIYDQLVAAVPAEMRPAAVLAKKMASLNANTTGARGSAMTAEDVPDFMNEYGDEIAARMVEADPILERKLLNPLKDSDGKNEGLSREDAARKVTGRLTLLPLEDQEAFYKEFLSEYKDYLAQKEAAGEATLEAKTLALDAKPVSNTQVVAATNAESPFGAAVNRGVYDVKRLGKPMKPEAVIAEINKNIGEGVTDADPDQALSKLVPLGQSYTTALYKAAIDNFDIYRREVLDSLDEDKVAKNAEKLNANVKSFRSLLQKIYPGATIRLSDKNGEHLYGVVIGLEKKGDTKNPLALGSFRATIALADAQSRLTIPLSQLRTNEMEPNETQLQIVSASNIAGRPAMRAFSEMQTESREQRTILTGNMLAAYDHVGGKGQIVNFIDHDGKTRSGVIMRRGYDYDKEMATKPVEFRTSDQVLSWIERGEKAFGHGVSIEKTGREITVITSASKAEGGKYFLNTRLRSVLRGDFYKTSKGMVADTSISNARDVIDVLQSLGATLSAKSNLSDARDIVASVTKQSRSDGGNEPSLVTVSNLSDRLRQLGIHDKVALRIVNALQGNVRGTHQNVSVIQDGKMMHSLITVAMSGDPVFTLNHEAVHALRSLGLFTPNEWAALSRRAAGDADLMASINRRYPELSQSEKLEEAIADMFGQRAKDGNGFGGRLFDRILGFISALRSWAQGNGFVSAEHVMRAMENGEIGSRDNAPNVKTTMRESRQDDDMFSKGPPTHIINRLLGDGVDDVGTKLKKAADSALPDPVHEILHEMQLGLSPMAAGSERAQATAKDFANALRLTAYQWGKVDEWLTKTFDADQRRAMWEAADEHGVLLRKGIEPSSTQGLNRLTDVERATVVELQRRADASFNAAKALDMVTGDGLESYVPRMIVQMTVGGPRVVSKASPKQARNGANLSTTTGQLRQRKYETVEETEAAAQAAFGAGTQVVRDIRTLGLATQKLDQAIAGRTLVNKIKAMSKDADIPLVVEGTSSDPSAFFTMDHPALQKWGPRMITDKETGKRVPALDQNGDMTFEATPLYVSKEFEGPLKAVLSTPSSGLMRALMDLKAKMMSIIMYSPLMHNMVIWGKAIPADPIGVLTFRAYRSGNLLRKDPMLMSEAINAGLDPIGHRFFNQDISGIAAAEGQDLTPGRSWTAQMLSAVPGLFDPAAGEAVKRGVDKMGDFWHNTLLWDRIADLQAGLYAHIRDDLLKKGVDPLTAQRAAAHFANRYAGALPMEGLSKLARSTANLLLFSRSFTLGNLATYKDMMVGLPSDVRAQIDRDSGPDQLSGIQGLARRKAIGMLMIDVGLAYVGLALAAHAVAWLSGQKYQAPQNNEQSKTQRFLIGYQNDGTAIYGRLPTGKVAEDLVNWIYEPRETLLHKLSPYGRLMYVMASNDNGYGQKVYDPYDHSLSGVAKNTGRVTWNFMTGMAPMGQLEAAKESLTGTAPNPTTAKLQAIAPLFGLTISKGAPGGPAMADIYAAKDERSFRQSEARPEINHMIQTGDIAGARKLMTDVGIAPSLQNYTIRVQKNPQLRMSPKQVRDFMMSATPEQKAQFLADRQASVERATQ